MKINGETHYLWHTVDHEGEVLESYVRRRRDRKAALKVIGNVQEQETGRWLNNRAENSHLPFRRRARAMLRFRQMRCLQEFAAVHSSVHHHFSQERRLYSRDNFKLNRTAALTEWRKPCPA